jgi:catechol 2,3-dioxygenase-like lactoylglutathione lyase family enzyme
MGTANTLFRLDNTYLELLAPRAEEQGALADAVRDALGPRRERPFALALGVADLDAEVAALRGRGLTVTDAADGAGTDDHTGVRRTWRSAFLDRRSTRGVSLFLIQHTSPAALLPLAEPAAAVESTAAGVDHVVVFTQDLDASRALWVDALGLREAWRREFPERGTRNLGLDVGGIVVELIQRTDRAPSDRPDALWGVAYRVGVCGAAVARARAAGVAVDDPRPGLAGGTQVATLRWERSPTLFLGPERGA